MANGYINTVPLGQAGTGSAFVLGPNMALERWLQGQQVRDQRRFQLQQQGQAIQRQGMQAFNQGMASLPTPGRLYNNDLQELVSSHVQEGARLMAQGVNPYNPNWNDPNQAKAAQNFLQADRQVRNVLGTVQAIEKQQQADIKKYRENPDSFDWDSFQDIMNFEQNNPIESVVSGQAQLPSLQQAFNFNKFVKDNVGAPKITVEETVKGEDGMATDIKKTEPNIAAIEQNVKSAFTYGPGANYLSRRLREAGIENARADGLLQTTDPAEIRRILDEEFRSPTENNPVVELMARGRIPSIGSPEYNDFLDEAVRYQLKAEKVADTVFNDAIKAAAGRIDSSFSEKPNFDYLREKDRQIRRNQAQQRINQSAARASGSGSDLQIESRDLPIYYGDVNKETGSQPSVIARNYTPVDLSAKNFVGSKAIDLATGKPLEFTESSNDYSTVGFGIVPVLNKKKRDLPQGSLVQPNYEQEHPEDVEYRQVVHVTRGTGNKKEDFLVDINTMPQNLTKRDQEKVNAFKSRGQTSNPTVKSNDPFLNLFQ